MLAGIGHFFHFFSQKAWGRIYRLTLAIHLSESQMKASRGSFFDRGRRNTLSETPDLFAKLLQVVRIVLHQEKSLADERKLARFRQQRF
jgi:hypothetical protein